jgi:competence protein ComEA
MIRQLFTAILAALAMSTVSLAAAATDVNRASVAELETIKGIGPALSAKITSARQQAPFKDWADLVDRVSGLGPTHAQRFSQAGLTVAGAAYVPTAAAAKTSRKQATAGSATDRAKPADASAKPGKPAQAAQSSSDKAPARVKASRAVPQS